MCLLSLEWISTVSMCMLDSLPTSCACVVLRKSAKKVGKAPMGPLASRTREDGFL